MDKRGTSVTHRIIPARVRSQRENTQYCYNYHNDLDRDSADMPKAIQFGMSVGLMTKRNLPPSDHLVYLPVEGFDVTLPIFLYWRENDTGNALQRPMRQSIINFYQALPGE